MPQILHECLLLMHFVWTVLVSELMTYRLFESDTFFHFRNVGNKHVLEPLFYIMAIYYLNASQYLFICRLIDDFI